MSDITIGDAPAAGAVAEPDAAQAGVAATDPFDSADVQTFDRAYVQKLREEAAKHRTEKKKYEDAFSGWTDPEDQSVWLETIQAAADPNSRGSAADQLRKIADLLAPGAAKDAADAAANAAEAKEDASGEAEKPLTKAELDKIFEEREQEAEKNRLLKQIEDEAKGLGYEKNTAQYAQLMFHANFNTKGNLEEAHKRIEAERQQVIDDYVAGKAKDANLPSGGQGSGLHASTENKPKSITEASDAVLAMLKAAQAE